MNRPRGSASALAAARRRLAELDVTATGDQLYYEACRAALPVRYPPRRPGFLLPRPLSRRSVEAALDRSGGRSAVPEPVGVPLVGTDAPDLFDYAVPRVLVCQHEPLAAALLADDLHMEASTALLGPAAGADPPPALAAALAAAPRPVVFLLHDATASGAYWAAATASAWHPLPVHDLGLHPAQARRLHLFRAPGGGVEVAAVAPDHLQRVLRRILLGRPGRAPRPSLRAHAGTGFLSWPVEGR